jgi:predicted nucleic acid-binding Zn finger protein
MAAQGGLVMCEARQERGRKIADTCKIEQRGKLWAVPSQSGDRHYLVNLQREYCNCPDFIERGEPCKHIYAARIVVTKNERHADGSETVSTLTVEAKVERKSYPQDWANYNRAQVNEHRLFQSPWRSSSGINGRCTGTC